MFDIQAASVICTLKDALLERQGYSKTMKAFWVSLDASLTYYGYERDGNTRNGWGDRGIRRRIFFVFTANTTVFMAVEGPDDRWFDAYDVPLDSWQYTSSHDSCWRTDGVSSPLNQLFLDWYDQILAGEQDPGREYEEDGERAYEPLPEDIRPAPRDLHSYVSLGGIGKAFGFGVIQLGEVPADNWLGRSTVIKSLTSAESD